MTEDVKQPEQGTQPEAGAQIAPLAEASPPTEPATLGAVTNPGIPQAIAAAGAPKANPVIRGKVPTVPADAPQYRVKLSAKPHFLNGRVVQPGELVRYAGVPGTGLEPLDDAARAAVKEADAARAKRKAEAEDTRLTAAKLAKALKQIKG